MRRRRIILAGALVLGAAVIALVWPRGPREPVYEGKPLSGWIHETQLQGISHAMGTREAIRSIGTNALPWLMSEFSRPPSRWRRAFNQRVARHTKWAFRFASDNERIAIACEGLHALGPDAAPALPMLAGHLSDERNWNAVAWAMSGCGERALAYFLEAFSATNQFAKQAGEIGLQYLAGDTEAAIPCLISMLADTNKSVREFAAVALWRKAGAARAVPALIKALSDPDFVVQYDAARALGDVKEEARPAVPELRRLMNDPNVAVARVASNALYQIDPSALGPRAR